MANPGRESRPAGEPGGTANVTTTATTSIIAPHADIFGANAQSAALRHHWIASANGAACERLALVAVVEASAGRYRPRVFLTLEAAHRAAADRGLDARVLLCELVPVRGDKR